MVGEKVKQVVRVFDDSTAEILEGKSLESFLAQESVALSLLMTHSLANLQKGEIQWVPIKGIQITR